MPTAVDNISRMRVMTHRNAESADVGPPSGDQILNCDPKFASVLIVNMLLSDASTTATVQVWVYDTELGWGKSEAFSIPGDGNDPDYMIPAKADTVGQTVGITITEIAGGGNVTITGALVSANVGGNF